MLADEVLSLLAKEISESEYNRYIKNIKFLEKESKSDIAVFEAINPIIANWVKTKYSKKIAHIFELKTGLKPEVQIITKSFSQQTKSVKKSQNNNTQTTISSKLNPSYTFDRFVVGSSNQVA